MKTWNTITVYKDTDEDRFIKGWVHGHDFPHTWAGKVEYHKTITGEDYYLIAITHNVYCDNHYFNRVMEEL